MTAARREDVRATERDLSGAADADALTRERRAEALALLSHDTLARLAAELMERVLSESRYVLDPAGIDRHVYQSGSHDCDMEGCREATDG